jgi:hypothetical protein
MLLIELTCDFASVKNAESEPLKLPDDPVFEGTYAMYVHVLPAPSLMLVLTQTLYDVELIVAVPTWLPAGPQLPPWLCQIISSTKPLVPTWVAPDDGPNQMSYAASQFPSPDSDHDHVEETPVAALNDVVPLYGPYMLPLAHPSTIDGYDPGVFPLLEL